MPEIPINRGLLESSRQDINRLMSINGAEKVAKAMKATKDAITGLAAHQPPDLHALNQRLMDLGIRYHNNSYDGATAINICMRSLALEGATRRWSLTFSEWGLEQLRNTP